MGKVKEMSLFDVPKHFAEIKARKCIEALKSNGMEADYLPTAQEAVNDLLSKIPEGASVGVGGSVTIRQLGILDILKKRGNKVFDHWSEGYDDPRSNVRMSQLTADVFLSSTNAITLDGKLLNTDGTGNRVASMFYGPPSVFIVAGWNKIVANLEEAFRRVKTTAAPMNAARPLSGTGKKQHPCALTGECIECANPKRMCKITVIIEKKPPAATKFSVLLVGETLGY